MSGNKVERIGETFAVIHQTGTVFSLEHDAAAKPSMPIHTPENQGVPIQNWGPSNLQPTEWRQKLEQSTTAYPLIVKAATTLFGKGPQYYMEVRTKKGIERDYSPVPEVEAFLQANDIDLIMLERWMDLKTYNNVFCEFIMNKTGVKCVNITHQEAEFCRFGQIENNVIKEVLVNAYWMEKSGEYETVPFVDDYSLSREEAIKIAKQKKKFITHNNVPSPGRTLYAVPSHVGLFAVNGWLDYALSVPVLMNKINKNGFSLKYHIEIPYDYWEKAHPDWKSKTEAQKKKIQDDKMDEMGEYLASSDGAGRNFYSHFGIHQATGKETSGWRITELKDPIKKDQFLTSLQEADMQAARSIGIDVSLANISNQSNSMGAGSGSDKRVGMDNTISASYAEQMIILKPLRTIGIINNWPRNLKWTFEHIIPTSLNENKSGTKTVS